MAEVIAMRARRACSTAPAADTRPIRLVIFDFDGTLSDSGEWFLSKLDQLAQRFNFRTVADHEVEMLRSRSSREVIDFLGIPRWKLPFIARHVRKLVGKHAGDIKLFPGTPRLLRQVHEMGFEIALVTSNAEANARRILGPELSALIPTWECGSSLFGKAPKFRRVVKRTGVAPHQILSIGDETRDIDAGKDVGFRTGAVLWGYAAPDALKGLEPEVTFETQEEILAFLARHI